jgi:basic membrane lipoprotein Med (substrate-binding protein (PBP1-ABC) superfamily)
MVARGVDVIAPVGDTQTNGANKEAISKSIYGIGYVNDLNSLSATHMLGSVYFNATTLCRMIIQDAMNNQLVVNGKGRFYNLALPQQGQDFILNPALVQSGTLSADAVAKINAARQAILGGTYVPTENGAIPAQPQG